jgi:signal transduction histidine kinase
MNYHNSKRLIIIVLALVAMVGCKDNNRSSVDSSDGYNQADSIISVIGDERNLTRLIEITDSFERAGDITEVRAIFYKSIAYNIMGQLRTSLNMYYKLAKIDVKELKSKADIDSYIYAYKDYIRLLCNMRRYDRVLREAYNADRKLKAAGYNSFIDHHDIAQMIGECQLYLNQASEAANSFQKSLKSMHARLDVNHEPLDYLECQKNMNAIARSYIHTNRFNVATPWIERQDSLYDAAIKHPHRDSIFIDEMKAEINYSKALLAQAQGRKDDAEQAYALYLSTNMAKQLGSIINSNEYLMLTQRYEEAARNYRELDRFLKERGYKADLEAIGRYMIPKYRANLMAGHRDSALRVASLVAEYYDTAIVRQKINDADLLSTIYDTEGKERQIAEQRAELSQQRLITVVSVMVIFIIFFLVYTIQRRKAYRQLMLANERAEESSRMKTEFIRQISHEVRTPLNLLSGFSQVLSNWDIEINYDEMQDICKKIGENSERITHLMDKMLDLSMVNSDAEIECSDMVCPADVVAQAVKESRIQKAEHLEFQLQLSPEAKSISFITNQRAALKALTQLLDNAIKFTHPLAFKNQKQEAHHARVTLNVSVDQQQVVFVVEDTGIGIPPEQAERIFTAFVQLNEYSEGTGIGLTISRSLIRHMHGDITLDTSYTDGARFVMSLPLS